MEDMKGKYQEKIMEVFKRNMQTLESEKQQLLEREEKLQKKEAAIESKCVAIERKMNEVKAKEEEKWDLLNRIQRKGEEAQNGEGNMGLHMENIKTFQQEIDIKTQEINMMEVRLKDKETEYEKMKEDLKWREEEMRGVEMVGCGKQVDSQERDVGEGEQETLPQRSRDMVFKSKRGKTNETHRSLNWRGKQPWRAMKNRWTVTKEAWLRKRGRLGNQRNQQKSKNTRY